MLIAHACNILISSKQSCLNPKNMSGNTFINQTQTRSSATSKCLFKLIVYRDITGYGPRGLREICVEDALLIQEVNIPNLLLAPCVSAAAVK